MVLLGFPLVFKQAKLIYSFLIDPVFSFRFRNYSHSQIQLTLYPSTLKTSKTSVVQNSKKFESSDNYIYFENTRVT